MAIANLSYRYILMCDDFKAIAIGLVFGATLGSLWFALIKSTHPEWLFYGDEKQSKNANLDLLNLNAYMNNYNTFFT